MRKRFSLILVTTLIPVALCAQAYGELNENDIRFRMFSNGYIGSKQGITPLGGFEVPQGSGANALFAGGLWFGGVDTTGSLHVAASLYNALDRKDFFPGPLTNDGSASIDPNVSDAYDDVWVVSRSEIAMHLAYHQCLNDPDCELATVFPDGYTAPPSIMGWPANNQNVGYEPLLAPFYDMNMDGHYDPEDGDVPCILGDQAMFAVFNDMLHPHTESGGLALGLEVQVIAFVFSDQGPALDQTIFLRYHIIDPALNC